LANFSHILAKLTTLCSRDQAEIQHGYILIRTKYSEKNLGIQFAKRFFWGLKCLKNVKKTAIFGLNISFRP